MRHCCCAILEDHCIPPCIHRFPTEGKLDVSGTGQPPPHEQQYPVMDTQHKNVFEPQPMPDPGKHKELTGPMFKIDR